MKKLNVDYYDVKNKLPIIGDIVSVFFENKAYSGHGILNIPLNNRKEYVFE